MKNPKLFTQRGARESLSNLMPLQPKTDIYDMCWNHMEMQDGHYPYVGDVFLKPAELDNMVLISKILSEGIPFVRVDFNIWNRKIYMGELTFYHSAGFEKFRPEKWDDVLGGWINLPLR